MSEIEEMLRSGLHGRLDAVDLDPRLTAGVPNRAARLRRRRTAVVSGAVALTLLAGVGLAVTVTRLGEDRTSIGLTKDTDGGARVDSTPGLRAQRYAQQFASGDFDSIRVDMTPFARKALTVSRLRGTWRGLFENGDPIDVGEPRDSVTDDRPVGSAVARSASTRAVLRIVLDEGGDIRSVLVTADGDADFEADPGVRRTREVVSQLADGDFDGVRRDFDTTMTKGLSARRLEQAWQQIVAQYGEFQRVDGVIARLEGELEVVDAVCEFAEGTMKVRVAYDGSERIAGLFILVLDA